MCAHECKSNEVSSQGHVGTSRYVTGPKGVFCEDWISHRIGGIPDPITLRSSCSRLTLFAVRSGGPSVAGCTKIEPCVRVACYSIIRKGWGSLHGRGGTGISQHSTMLAAATSSQFLLLNHLRDHANIASPTAIAAWPSHMKCRPSLGATKSSPNYRDPVIGAPWFSKLGLRHAQPTVTNTSQLCDWRLSS